VKIDHKHELPLDEARERLKILGEYLHNRHGLKVTWLDANRARFAGKYLVVAIDGEITIEEKHVKFRGADPGFLWRKKANEYIHNKLRQYLDPTIQPADLSRG
jgi:hypothetical protein